MHDPGTDPRSKLCANLIAAAGYDALLAPTQTPAAARELLAGVTPEQLLDAPVASPAAAYAMLSGLWLWHDGLAEAHAIAQKSPADLERMAMVRLRAAGKVELPVQADGAASNADIPGHRRLPAADAVDMTATLNYWHAIMHRREGDFWNSKYWNARCRGHEVFASLGQHATPLLNPLPADKLVLRLLRDGWDPDAFVDLVEEVHARPGDPRRSTVVALQQIEWRLLFDHCVRHAVGA